MFLNLLTVVTLFLAAILGIVPGRSAEHVITKDQDTFHQISLAFHHQQNDSYSLWCSGSIISNSWIVTAASCVDYRFWPNKTATLVVISGSVKPGDVAERSIHRINQTIHYPWYYKNEWNETTNDVALISVMEIFELDELRKSVPLYDQDEETKADSNGIVIGWTLGKDPIAESGHSEIVNVKIISKYECNTALHGGLSYNGQICAGYSGSDEESCDGKTGSPLIVNGRLAGILSWNRLPCDPPDYPSVYAEVGYFRNWIKSFTDV